MAQIEGSLRSSEAHAHQHGTRKPSNERILSRSIASSFVTALYTDYIGRVPTAAEMTAALKVVGNGSSDAARAKFAKELAQSDTYYGAVVNKLYRDTLGRNADPGGLAYFMNLAKKSGRSAVSYPVYQSPESCRTRVKGLYEHFLGRQPDAGGLNYWAGKVATAGDIALAANLTTSAEYLNRSITRFP